MVTIFEQGDIVYLDFDPQSGHEQKGRCPALVVSNDLFNRVSSLTMVCPITHTDRNSPFHLRLDRRTRTDGVIMCDQARMLDLRSRHAAFEGDIVFAGANDGKTVEPCRFHGGLSERNCADDPLSVVCRDEGDRFGIVPLQFKMRKIDSLVF